jgi:uncharacterized protein
MNHKFPKRVGEMFMNELKNCKICGRLFQLSSFYERCPICIERDEEDFSKIREYLDLHPFAKIFEVSTNLNISISKIKRYLRDGRIEIVEKNNQFLKCEICGRSICSGHYCEECCKSNVHDFTSYYVGGAKHKKEETKINYKKNPYASKARTAI